MASRKVFTFLLQAVTVGIVAAVTLVVFKPELLRGERPVVAFQQAQAPREALPAQGPVSYADAVARAAPAVVNIQTTKRVAGQQHPFLDDPLFRRFFGGGEGTLPERLESSLGSGVIVSPQGYVLTNNHVIEGADEILVALKDGHVGKARVVGTDPETDLAVLRVELGELPAITIGDSSRLRVGDVVLAIGNPFGVGQTVTQGIVSATGRNQLGINTFEDFIQTDAAINPGNSGGALINAYGDLVGINTAIFSRSGGSQGIGFAIPLGLAKDVMAQIIESGRVARGWLGVEIQDVTPELAESFGLDAGKGAIVAGVLRDGPAHAAGLQPGDIILQVEETPVHNVQEALNAIAKIRPGTRIRISGSRDRRSLSLDATVGERPPQTNR